MYKKYVVKLSEEEKQHLEKITSSGTAPVRMVRRAQILLKSDQGNGTPCWTYNQISEAFNVTPLTVSKVNKRFVEQGLEAAICRKKPEREYLHCLDGEAEAHLIALACSKPPNGKARWTLRLLQDRMIELEHVESVSHETIRTTLKKMNSNPG